MTLTPGTRLGPYEIVAPLGAGGMGEVYRARDPRLEREVAIKVLPDEVAADAERLARFEREARVLAGLSHTGIASIFGVEDAGRAPALVMELVEGPTLADRIAVAALAAEEALAIARQLAEAIEYAHDHGVVHRDLKPANVKLRPDGVVKVLDFGLARALDAETASAVSNPDASPTLTARMTRAGLILGTAAYMAPEQARGRPADRRADVFAFGAVLYEMLTGRRAFAGETVSDTLVSVMRDEPDWSALPENLPARFRELLSRCLTKDPRRRLQSIGEARIALEDVAAGREDGNAPARERAVAPRRGPLRAIPWAVAIAALAVAGAALVRRPPPSPAATEVGFVPAEGRSVGLDLSYHPLAIAPDGRSVAYTVRVAGVLRLRLRRLDTREDVEIAGAVGARNLFFSPDGQWIGFFDSRKLSKVSVRGGTPVELADAMQDRLGAWLDDGTIVYSREVTEPLYRIPESGGTPETITTLDETRRERTHRFPSALDGGPWIVFTVQTVESPGGYDDASIDAVSVATGERRRLFRGFRRAVWAPGGSLVLARGSDLYAVPIDPEDPRALRDPVPVLADVSGDDSSGASYFDIAGDGTLVWIPGGEPDRVRDVGWYDRAGRWSGTQLPPGPYSQLYLSPDGQRALVLAGPGGGGSDLWVADLATATLRPVTHGGHGGSAAWLPDGQRIVHSRHDDAGQDVVVVRRLDGAGGELEIARANHPLMVTGITPGGREVSFSDYGVPAGQVHVAATDDPAKKRALPVEGSGYEQAGVPSPDGRWLALVSNKTRREEVCIRRLDGAGGSWQVSTGGGGGVRWGRDGRELFFVSGEILMSVTIDVRGEDLSFGQPVPLFDVPPSPTEETFRDYDYDPRADRFLFTRPPKGVAERREIAVSLGWADRLRGQIDAAGR